MRSMPQALPTNWQWCRFDQVARVASNLVNPAHFSSWPHVAPNHIESATGRLLAYSTVVADGVTSPKHRFEPGQVLYSKIRPYLAKVVVADFEGLCSADMYPIDTELDSRFLKWWMLTDEFTALAARQQARTILPKINARALNALPIPVPPAEEQRRIVDVLEDHLSRLDAGLDQLRAAQRRNRSLRDAALRGELLGRRWPGDRWPCDLPAADVDDGVLSDLPAGWEWRRLQDVADVVGGVTKDASKQGDPSFVEVPYLRVANVQRGRLDLRTISRIRVPPAKLEQLRLEPGDVLLNEGGDRDKLGRGWVWAGEIEDCITQNHVFRARPRPGTLHPKLLSWAANSLGGPWCERNGKQSVNLASISLKRIRLMPLPVPPLAAQPELVLRLEDLHDRSARLDAVIDDQLARGAALRRSLLASAFSGRL
jgi:type I restriction enzyme S subunit